MHTHEEKPFGLGYVKVQKILHLSNLVCASKILQLDLISTNSIEIIVIAIAKLGLKAIFVYI
jgi:hypothetical protein